MIGTRIPGVWDGSLAGFAPGTYAKDESGVWYVMTPTGVFASIAKHTVVEHDNGTITVTPSILITSGGRDGRASWHGFLGRGVWRDG